MTAAFACVPVIAGGFARPAAAAALVGVVVARPPVFKVLEGASGAALIPVLAETARVQLVTGVVLALGLWVSA
jgi:1,4-dihydroxy-2-naphthoate octaprenyltransferase